MRNRPIQIRKIHGHTRRANEANVVFGGCPLAALWLLGLVDDFMIGFGVGFAVDENPSFRPSGPIVFWLAVWAAESGLRHKGAGLPPSICRTLVLRKSFHRVTLQL